MATSGRGSGIVGYNVQTAVDAKHHLIVAHEVTNVGNDRTQLSKMAEQAKTAMGADTLDVLADRGYFKGEEILACEAIGVTPFVPKSLTSGAKAEGRFGKQDFVYIPEDDTYRCPAGERLTRRYTSVEHGMDLHVYWTTACSACPLKSQCTTGTERRIKRWEHEAGDRRHAATPRPRAQCHAHPTADGRTPIRNDQVVDGRYPFPDPDARQGPNRDEPPCSRLQSEASDRHPRGSANYHFKGPPFCFFALRKCR
jgi:hypothetical protein